MQFLSGEVKSLREYIINFGNLKPGRHEYDFVIDDSFFRNFEYSLVKDGDIRLHLILDKQRETFFTLHFQMTGAIQVECDRCLDPFRFPVQVEKSLHVKLDSHENDNDDDLIFLDPEAYQIDLSPYIYDFINLSLPLRLICETVGKDCNPEMISLIQEGSHEGHENTDNDEIDPRWAGLRDISKDKDKK